MATDDFNQRLTQVETALTALRGELHDGLAELRQEIADTRAGTKTDLAALRGELHDDLVRELASVATNTNDLRGEVRVASAMLRQLVGAVAGITELLQALSERGAQLGDRIRRLEDRA